MANNLGLPKRKEEVMDMMLFDRKDLDDIDVKFFHSLYGDCCYKQIMDQLVPMAYRRCQDKSLKDISDFVSKVKAEWTDEVLSSLTYSDRSIMRSAIDEDLSFERLKDESMQHKHKEWQADDYYAFDAFMQDELHSMKFTSESREDAKMQSLEKVMRAFDARRFKYSSIENDAQSYEKAYYSVVSQAIYDKDMRTIVGLQACDWMLYRIIRKRNITQNVWHMLDCVNAIANRKCSQFSVEAERVSE